MGNPLFDGDEAFVSQMPKDYTHYDSRPPKVALLPGSRDAEIDTLWEPMQQIAIRLADRFEGIEFSVAAVDEDKLKVLESKQLDGFKCEYVIDDVPGLANRSDLTIVASGSATLQVAAAACPMVVMYQSSRLMWHVVGKWLINIKHLSLPNILACREVVPEFMPHFKTIDPIIESASELLADKSKLTRTSIDLVELVKPMAQHKASVEVANMVTEMIAE